jgi:hypothetical protein
MAYQPGMDHSPGISRQHRRHLTFGVTASMARRSRNSIVCGTWAWRTVGEQGGTGEERVGESLTGGLPVGLDET